MIDFSLTDEQKALQDLARKFAKKEIIPIALQYDKEAFVPDAILKKAHAAGLMNLTTPQAYGGHGMKLLEAALITEELNAGCAGIGGMITINSLACGPILIGGTDEQKKRFLIPLCESGKTASFGLTEREAGSDAAGVKTKAVRKGDEYVLNGQKCFITNASFAALYTIFATTDPGKGTKGITAFVVPRETPGVSIGKVEDKMGQRALDVAEVNLDDVVIPAANVLGAEGQGFKIAMETLNEGRINIATTALGIARAAFEASLAYAKQRVQFGKPIGTFQSINFMLADMAAAVDASRLLTWYAASRADQGLPFAREAAQAKLFASDTAMSLTTDAVQIHGGYGYTKEYMVEKLMRDAKLTQIYEGTNQVNRIVAGGALMR
ncbi:MAG: acyl-CoA dehydrogenase [Deltaproteobacteria bacterium HGW-Deltaproteobacteria-6]|jgi:alkylation response protein AidB-like acyl-CoA dehydrogenase|nr:MAG: acyl-CoA dehydrogenase [Deltaproteobacteria bacterium HGW-Deltaproteobacteria-6]